MDNNKILGGVLFFVLLIMILGLLNKHTTTVPVTSTKVVTSQQPNTYVVHTSPNYQKYYNPYKAQYYN